MRNMKKKYIAMAVALCAAVGAQAGILFQDDFSGVSTNGLNGTTPDVTQAGATWVASDAVFKADGSIVDSSNKGAWLAYAFEANKTYTLSADIISSAAADWIGFGFAQSVNAAGRHTEASVQGRAWLLTSEAGQQVFVGPRATNKVYDNEIITDTTSAFSTYTLTLDTTDASDVLLSVNMGGTTVVDEESMGAFADLNPGSFGFSTDAGSAGTIDNLSLSVIPEPATLGMVAAFGGGILFVRRLFMMG